MYIVNIIYFGFVRQYFRSFLTALVVFSNETNEQVGIPPGSLFEAIAAAANEAVEACFEVADLNHDDRISFEEFQVRVI